MMEGRDVRKRERDRSRDGDRNTETRERMIKSGEERDGSL